MADNYNLKSFLDATNAMLDQKKTDTLANTPKPQAPSPQTQQAPAPQPQAQTQSQSQQSPATGFGGGIYVTPQMVSQFAQKVQEQNPNFTSIIPQDNQQQPQQGGMGGALSGVGNYLKDTGTDFVKTMLPAVGARVLFGNTQFGEKTAQMFMANQLDTMKQKETDAKNSTIAQLSTGYVRLRGLAVQLGIPQDKVQESMVGGSKTGNPKFDQPMQQYNTMLQKMYKDGKIDASGIDSMIQHGHEFEKLLHPDIEWSGEPYDVVDPETGKNTKYRMTKQGTVFNLGEAVDKNSELLSPAKEAQEKRIRQAGKETPEEAGTKAGEIAKAKAPYEKPKKIWVYNKQTKPG